MSTTGEIATLHRPFSKWLTDEGLCFLSARSDQPSGIAEGAQDFTVLSCGRALCIEFKTKEGKLRAAQVRWHERMKQTGTTVFVCRDLNSAMLLVREWLQQAPETAKYTTAPARGRQYRVGGKVWEDNGYGYFPIRPVGPNDLSIPEL